MNDVAEAELKALEDAVWQVLDDMGVEGTCCCLAAKAALRIAYEPFKQEDDEGLISLEAAKAIIAEIYKR